MSLVSLSDAQDRVGDAVTQDMIDEVEEGWKAVIGPLVGERTETFFLSERRMPLQAVDGLYLARYTDSVAITNATTGESPSELVSGTDFILLNHHLVERVTAGAAWLDVLVATYTPNDEERVRSVIFDTLTYAQTPVGTQSIRIGAYSETYFPDAFKTDPVLGSLIRKILPAAGLGITSPFRYAAHRRDRTLITGGDGS